MAGRGRAPKPNRRNKSDKPSRGEFTAAEGGWQHGAVPDPPEGLMPASVTAWQTWMGAWFAAHWTPDDIPGLRQLVRLYDQVERGEFQRASELRLSMDTYGITPKGQQDRRWMRPKAEEDTTSPSQPARAKRAKQDPDDHYAHLRVVNE